MEGYPYKQAAIFANEESARQLERRIQNIGFQTLLMFVLSPADPTVNDARLEPQGDPAAVVHKALYGGTGGALTGLAASVAAGAFKLALFAGHPLAISLAAIGYGATVGTGGALVGENLKEELFVNVLEDALRQGQWAVIIHAPDKETARKIKVLLEHVHGAENLVKN